MTQQADRMPTAKTVHASLGAHKQRLMIDLLPLHLIFKSYQGDYFTSPEEQKFVFSEHKCIKIRQ